MNRIYLNSCDGRVFTLETDNDEQPLYKPIRQVQATNLKVKKLSACNRGFWCVLQNFQVSLFIDQTSQDTAIKHQVCTFENQRRYPPFISYSNRLLFTDRYLFSSEDGIQDLPKDSFKLPSPNWSWDGDWFTEQSHASEGWEYAIDFPAKFYRAPFTTACVRRKKWMRNRTFNAYNRFIQIESPRHHDCMVDISVGGWNMACCDKGFLAVYAVSYNGKLFYRENVSLGNVEGTNWKEIRTPQNAGVVFTCSCSNNGQLWVVVSSGSVLVRNGITREKPYGTDWHLSIDMPGNDQIKIGLKQLAISSDMAWALTSQGCVFYRKGITAIHSPTGSKWIDVPGDMLCISVTEQNQLWAIDTDGYLCYREDIVVDGSMTGTGWRRIHLEMQKPEISNDKIINHTTVGLNKSQQDTETDGMKNDDANNNNKTMMMKMTDMSNQESSLNGSIYDGDPYNSQTESSIYDTYVDTNTDDDTDNDNSLVTNQQQEIIDFEKFQSSLKCLDHFIEHLKISAATVTRETTGRQSPTRIRSQQPSPVSVSSFNLESRQSPCVSVDTDQNDEFNDCPVLFKWCDASQCSFTVTKWWPMSSSHKTNEDDELWRPSIRDSLKRRNQLANEVSNIVPNDSLGVNDLGDWHSVDEFKRYRNGAPCVLEVQAGKGHDDVGGLLVIKTMKRSSQVVKNEIKLTLRQVTCITTARHGGNSPILAIYITQNDQNKSTPPHMFTATSERKLNEWIDKVSDLCARQWDFDGRHQNSLFALTNSDSNVYLALFDNHNIRFIKQLRGHFKLVERNAYTGFTVALGYNGQVWTLSNKHNGTSLMTDDLQMYTYENQRWNVLSGFSAIGLPTDRPAWSDETGKIRLNKDEIRLPSTAYQWSSDWQIDYSVYGGTDTHGWQYASDFPNIYHKTCNNVSFVRRRRWTRSCRIRIANTDWHQVAQVQQITSLSLIADNNEQQDDDDKSSSVSVWATEIDGNVLCSNISMDKKPTVCKWRYIQSEIGFKSITIGAKYQVYAISLSGRVYYRFGVNSTRASTGTQWSLLDDDATIQMKQISAGHGTLWAISEQNEAYFRDNITTAYPEGTKWVKICDKPVRFISCTNSGKQDRVYAIESGDRNSLLYRHGITRANPKGDSWLSMLSLKWTSLSNR